MPVYQGVIFQEVGVAGWSGVYYLSAADIVTAGGKLDNINTALLGVQSDVVNSLALRVSDVSIKGDGLALAPSVAVGQLPTLGTSVAPLNLAADFQFTTGDLIHRVRHFVHGVRLSDTETLLNGRTQLTDAYRALSAVTAYKAAVLANSVNWQKRSLPPVTAALTNVTLSLPMSVRRVGRPFGLFRGRRRTA